MSKGGGCALLCAEVAVDSMLREQRACPCSATVTPLRWSATVTPLRCIARHNGRVNMIFFGRRGGSAAIAATDGLADASREDMLRCGLVSKQTPIVFFSKYS